MLLNLHQLRIQLLSESPPVNRYWQKLLAGWLQAEASQDTGVTPDIRLELSLSRTLPPLPRKEPFFTDSHAWPDGVGILSVYDADGPNVLLHFLDGAVIKVPLRLEDSAGVMVVTGTVTEKALEYGRLEDITFTSLAPALRRRGYYLLHAFAATWNEQASLIVGPSGSGKTTSGLSLLLDGWTLLANDTLLLQERPDGIYALPTPGGISIRPETLDLLPGLRPFVADITLNQGKYDVSSQRLVGSGWASPAPITSVYFPHIGEEQSVTRCTPIGRGISLAQLMEESVDQWDNSLLPDHINVLQRLAKQSSSYTLHLGRDINSLPHLMAANVTSR